MKEPELIDELNPKYLFTLTYTDLLVQICHGQINPVELAENELAQRGLDVSGRFVGFKKKEVAK